MTRLPAGSSPAGHEKGFRGLYVAQCSPGSRRDARPPCHPRPGNPEHRPRTCGSRPRTGSHPLPSRNAAGAPAAPRPVPTRRARPHLQARSQRARPHHARTRPAPPGERTRGPVPGPFRHRATARVGVGRLRRGPDLKGGESSDDSLSRPPFATARSRSVRPRITREPGHPAHPMTRSAQSTPPDTRPAVPGRPGRSTRTHPSPTTPTAPPGPLRPTTSPVRSG